MAAINGTEIFFGIVGMTEKKLAGETVIMQAGIVGTAGEVTETENEEE